VWLPGKVSPEQAAFYVDLMKKVQATPEWKDYIEKTSQVDTFLTGSAFSDFIKQDLEHIKQVAGEQGWLVK
jgi:tripartite-type tricarboxylate transporter receptor subunit TctC